MTMIGSEDFTDECETLNLFDHGQLQWMGVDWDETGVRALFIKTGNGKLHSYGWDQVLEMEYT